MIAQIPTEVFPVWYIRLWQMKTADRNFAPYLWIDSLISDWAKKDAKMQAKNTEH